MGKISVPSSPLTLTVLLIGLTACKKSEPSNDVPQALLPDSYEYPSDVPSDSVITEPESVVGQPKQDLSGLKQFKYSWTDSDDIPPVIVIVDDFGYSGGSLLQGFAELPREIVFAILPDLPFTARSAQIAAETGRDAIIHVPMEAAGAKISRENAISNLVKMNRQSKICWIPLLPKSPMLSPQTIIWAAPPPAIESS